jgi:hypothetical protein
VRDNPHNIKAGINDKLHTIKVLRRCDDGLDNVHNITPPIKSTKITPKVPIS